MLETRDLVKIYKPKKGVPVTALNKVSLRFPEKGMVFLLGKSGSGKSTLLNVLGGLDSYNDGEIIIKGVSSKKFKQKHFDSYRNTYVGFIFQEYNVLDEFTVGANIALAIELQNRKATDKEVNSILKEVDLEGYGNRKPNELSGGQKQRVAIARALVKNPQIIMADEPTGALDSNTGKAIFDTLKKLSGNKLVIVVSHDREFAENYADRIIELSDGVVISDVECDSSVSENENVGLGFNGNVIEVPAGYHITEDDRRAINDYILALKEGNAQLSVMGKGSKRFVKTDASKIKAQDSSTFKLIKSKLPLKNAFKIGSSGLKHKKFRLVITILLSCISFGLFGLADTFGAYNHIKTCTNSLADSNLNYVATAKAKRIEEDNNRFYWRDYGYSLSVKDLSDIKQNTGVEMHGVYLPLEFNADFNPHIDQSVSLSETDLQIYNPYFTGITEINNEIIKNMGFSLLAGTLPDGTKNEIAISEYTLEVFKKAKYTDGVPVLDKNGEAKFNYTEIKSNNDILGKALNINGVKYTITAVIDTHFDLERYAALAEKAEFQSTSDELVDYVLYSEFNSAFSYSYSGLMMTGEGFVERMLKTAPPITPITEGYLWFYGDTCSVDTNYVARLSDVAGEKIVWLNGEKATLGEKELIVTTDAIHFWEDENAVMSEDYATTEEYYKALLNKVTNLEAHIDLFNDKNNEVIFDKDYKIVGFIEITEKSKVFSTAVCSDSLFSTLTDGHENIYAFAVGTMPKEKSDINRLVSYCYREDSNVRYQIQNSVTFELDAVNEFLQEFSKIFLYIGLGFAVFAALMLANFIATSISYKKQEIGILRAIGSRSNDVFRIFFAESFIIAMINFVLSAVGVFIVTQVINYIIRTEVGILITILSFGPRQIILLLAVSIAVAFIASFLPVKRIASKKPIDAIRDR